MRNKFINPIKRGIGVLPLLILMLVSATPIKAQESYGLKIAGVEVTSENCNDLSVISSVRGKVKYDPATNTLYLEDARIANLGRGITNQSLDRLIINVTGEDTIITEYSDAIELGTCQTIIKGNGKLKVVSNYCNGISFKNSLEIDSCTLHVQSYFSYGITGKKEENDENRGSLAIHNAKVTTESSSGSICNIASLDLDSCVIFNPKGAAFNESLHAVAFKGEMVKGKVIIERGTEVNYGLKIAGVDVTDKNCNDLSEITGVDGIIKYNPEDQILTLENVTIATDEVTGGIHNDSIENLVINITGENNVKAYYPAIYSALPTTIQGDGTLNANSATFFGIGVAKDTLTIDGCTVNANGCWGIMGGNEDVVLSIKNNAKVSAEGNNGSILSFSSLALDKSVAIVSPIGVAFDDSLRAVVRNGNVVNDLVVIDKPIYYGLVIAGYSVTSKNYNDLSVIPGVSGTAKYDPETKTLFLEDAKISYFGNCIKNDTVDGLTINITGESQAIASIGHGIYLGFNSTTIKGGGKLLAVSNFGSYGIFFAKSLEIDSCKLHVQGDCGIAGKNGTEESLIIRNTDIYAYAPNGPICKIASLTLDGCKITNPEEAAFDENVKAVALNGEIFTGTLEITSDRTVGIKDVKSKVSTLKQGIYSLDGVYLGNDFDSLPKGIYIKDGKKVLK